MSLTFATKTFTADGGTNDSTVYSGPAKTISRKDDLLLRRQAVKPTSVFSGVSRTEAKLSRTLDLTGALTPTSDAYLDLGGMIPVGASDSDVNALIDDFAAFIASASFKTHIKARRTNF